MFIVSVRLNVTVSKWIQFNRILLEWNLFESRISSIELDSNWLCMHFSHKKITLRSNVNSISKMIKLKEKKNGLRRADVRLVCTVPWHKLTQERRLFKETFKLFSIAKHDSVRCSISVWRYTNQRLSAFTTHFCVDYFFHSCSTEAWWKVFTQYVVRYILRLLAYLLIVLIFSRRTWYHNIQ